MRFPQFKLVELVEMDEVLPLNGFSIRDVARSGREHWRTR